MLHFIKAYLEKHSSFSQRRECLFIAWYCESVKMILPPKLTIEGMIESTDARDWRYANFTSTLECRIVFQYLHLHDLDLSHCNFTFNTFEGVSFKDSMLANAKFEHAILFEIDLTNVRGLSSHQLAEANSLEQLKADDIENRGVIIEALDKFNAKKFSLFADALKWITDKNFEELNKSIHLIPQEIKPQLLRLLRQQSETITPVMPEGHSASAAASASVEEAPRINPEVMNMTAISGTTTVGGDLNSTQVGRMQTPSVLMINPTIQHLTTNVNEGIPAVAAIETVMLRASVAAKSRSELLLQNPTSLPHVSVETEIPVGRNTNPCAGMKRFCRLF